MSSVQNGTAFFTHLNAPYFMFSRCNINGTSSLSISEEKSDPTKVLAAQRMDPKCMDQHDSSPEL